MPVMFLYFLRDAWHPCVTLLFFPSLLILLLILCVRCIQLIQHTLLLRGLAVHCANRRKLALLRSFRHSRTTAKQITVLFYFCLFLLFTCTCLLPLATRSTSLKELLYCFMFLISIFFSDYLFKILLVGEPGIGKRYVVLFNII